MRLAELDPRWLVKDGKRRGIIFRTPQSARPASGRYYQTCFFQPTPYQDQREIVWAATEDLRREGQQHFGDWQPCNPATGWEMVVGPDETFDTLTIRPSIDGSAGGLWHGFISNGEIVGGLT